MVKVKHAAVLAAFALLAAACGGGGGDAQPSDAATDATGGAATDGASDTAAQPTETLTLGAALSLTGKLSREGTLTRDGYELCKEVVNSKGGVDVGGTAHSLEIVYQDDTSTPDVAAQLVDGFNDQGIKLVLGPYGSASTEAAAAVVERNAQVMVEGAGADDKMFEKGYTRTFAVLSPATNYLGSIVRAVAELADPKPQTVAILSADDGFSVTAAEGGRAEAEAQGMEVVAVEYFPNGATDVSAALTKIRPLDADLVLGSVHLAEGIAIIRQSSELGVAPTGGFGLTVAVPTPDFAQTLGPLAENVLGSSQWTPQVDGSDEWFGSAQDYAARFTQRFNTDPEYHHAEASAACLAMVMAIEQAGTIEPDPVREALDGLDADSFFGRITFDDTGKNAEKPMSVVQIQGGKPLAVWPAAEGIADLIWPATAA